MTYARYMLPPFSPGHASSPYYLLKATVTTHCLTSKPESRALPPCPSHSKDIAPPRSLTEQPHSPDTVMPFISFYSFSSRVHRSSRTNADLSHQSQPPILTPPLCKPAHDYYIVYTHLLDFRHIKGHHHSVSIPSSRGRFVIIPTPTPPSRSIALPHIYLWLPRGPHGCGVAPS